MNESINQEDQNNKFKQLENQKIIELISTKKKNSVFLKEDVNTIEEFFKKQKITEQEIQEMMKLNAKIMFNSDFKSEKEIGLIEKKLILELYSKSNKKLEKIKKKKGIKIANQSAKINSELACLKEEKNEVKRMEENFFRNIGQFQKKQFSPSMGQSIPKNKGGGNEKKGGSIYSFEKVLKFLNNELTQKEQLVYKNTFMIQELKKQIKKQKQKEQHSMQTKALSKIDFDQLKIENAEMKQKLKKFNHAIIKVKKKIVHLKQTKNFLLKGVTERSKRNQTVSKKLERKDKIIRRVKKQIISIENERKTEQLKNKKLLERHSNLIVPSSMDYIALIRQLEEVRKKSISWKRKNDIGYQLYKQKSNQMNKLKRITKEIFTSKGGRVKIKTRPYSSTFSRVTSRVGTGINSRIKTKKLKTSQSARGRKKRITKKKDPIKIKVKRRPISSSFVSLYNTNISNPIVGFQ